MRLTASDSMDDYRTEAVAVSLNPFEKLLGTPGSCRTEIQKIKKVFGIRNLKYFEPFKFDTCPSTHL